MTKNSNDVSQKQRPTTVKQVDEVAKVAARLPPVEGVGPAIIADCYIATLSRVLAKTPPLYTSIALLLVVGQGPLICWYGASELARLGDVNASLSVTLLVLAAFTLALIALGILGILLILRWSPYGYMIDQDRRVKRSNAALNLGVTTASAAACPVAAMFLGVESVDTLTWLSVCLYLANFGVPVHAMARLRKPQAGIELQPLDRTGTRLVVASILINDLAREPVKVSPRSIRMLMTELEILARDAEQFAVDRVPWWDRSTRSAVRGDGLRLAAVIRAHKPRLAKGITGEDLANVAKSLAGGAGAWANQDLKAMLRGSPDVKPPRGLRPLLGRLGPAALLATLGVVLPLVPPLNQVAQAGDSFRIAMLIAAALALTGGTSPTSDIVKTAVDKTLFPRS